MGKSNYALSAPESILAAARRAAKRDGVSLNQFINTALAEKVAALEAEDVFTRRGASADKARFLARLRLFAWDLSQFPGFLLSKSLI